MRALEDVDDGYLVDGQAEGAFLALLNELHHGVAGAKETSRGAQGRHGTSVEGL
jgi:hypothetical protein